MVSFTNCSNEKKGIETTNQKKELKNNTELQKTLNINLKDTINFENEITNGKVSLLYINDIFIDTVDILYFGVKQISNFNIIYHKYKSESGYPKDIIQQNLLYGALEDFILYENNRKTLLTNILPLFNEWFSSPNIIDSLIYYWGLKLTPGTGETFAYAMRYNFKNSKLDSIYLFKDYIYTDNPGYFLKPILNENGFYFMSEKSGYLIKKDFKSKKKTD